MVFYGILWYFMVFYSLQINMLFLFSIHLQKVWPCRSIGRAPHRVGDNSTPPVALPLPEKTTVVIRPFTLPLMLQKLQYMCIYIYTHISSIYHTMDQLSPGTFYNIDKLIHVTSFSYS